MPTQITVNAQNHCTAFLADPLTLAELGDRLGEFIAEHDGARWHARFAVVGDAAIATMGDESCVWRLSPGVAASAEAMVIRTLAEYRAAEG